MSTSVRRDFLQPFLVQLVDLGGRRVGVRDRAPNMAAVEFEREPSARQR